MSTVEDFAVGDKVVTAINNVKVHGDVESIQLAKNLVDVKVYEPGNPSHCLIVSRPPDQVTLANDEPDQPAAGAPGLSEQDFKVFADAVEQRFSALEGRASNLGTNVSSLVSRVASLETSVSSLTSRVTSLESAVAKLTPAPITEQPAPASPIPPVKQ